MLKPIFKKMVEDVAIGLAAAATPVIIDKVQKHGPAAAKGAADALKNAAPRVAKGVKGGANSAKNTAKKIKNLRPGK